MLILLRCQLWEAPNRPDPLMSQPVIQTVRTTGGYWTKWQKLSPMSGFRHSANWNVDVNCLLLPPAYLPSLSPRSITGSCRYREIQMTAHRSCTTLVQMSTALVPSFKGAAVFDTGKCCISLGQDNSSDIYRWEQLRGQETCDSECQEHSCSYFVAVQCS